MKFGIEIEFYSPKNITSTVDTIKGKIRGIQITHSYGSNWKMVRDGSLADINNFTPMELVSPVLDTEKASDLRMVRRVCEVLQDMGSVVNSCCGLHVHIDAADLSVENIKTIFHRYTKFESMIDLMVPANRRGNNVYYTKGGVNIVNNVESCETREALMRVFPDRYYKVNLLALQKHGTIEFRQHSGSINADTILNWVSFLTSFVEASKSSPTVKTVKQRGRPANNEGMMPVCRKVYDVFMASYNNGGGSLFLDTIAYRTGLAKTTIKAAISMLKTKHGIIIKLAHGQRGVQNPVYVIQNAYAQPRLNTVRSTSESTVIEQDTVWRGVDKALKAYYIERIQELSGYGVQNLSM